MGSCRFTESGAFAVRRKTFNVEESIIRVPVAVRNCRLSCFPARPLVREAAVENALVSKVTFIASDPVKVEKRALGKNSRHLT